MVQTRMVGSTISCLWLRQADHAGLPVMLPHDSDSQVRRDGSDAAFLQLLHAVDERGRLHGVPALCRLQRLPVLTRRRIDFTALDKKRQSRILTPTNAQLRPQDKRTAVARPHVVGAIEQCTTPHKPRLALPPFYPAISMFPATALTAVVVCGIGEGRFSGVSLDQRGSPPTAPWRPRLRRTIALASDYWISRRASSCRVQSQPRWCIGGARTNGRVRN